MIQEDEKVVYTPYAELPNPKLAVDTLDEHFLGLVALFESEGWKDNHSALEQLRVLNKFYFEYLCTKLDEVDPYVQVHLNSLRSGLLKTALLFMQELAGSEADAGECAVRSASLKGYLPRQIPVLLAKLLDAKKFIVKEAELALKNVAAKVCGPEVIVALCEQCFTGISKGTLFADNVMEYLELGVGARMSGDMWESCKLPLVVTLGHAVSTGRKHMVKKASSILAALKKTCGEEAVLAAVKGADVAKAEQQKLQELLAGKGEEKKKPDSGFKAFLQSKKKAKT